MAAEHLIKVGQDQGIAPVVDLLRSPEETVQQVRLWDVYFFLLITPRSNHHNYTVLSRRERLQRYGHFQ
jgi:hypothetical protein